MPICVRFMAGRPLSERSSSRLSKLANGNSRSIVLMNLTVFFCPPESAERIRKAQHSTDCKTHCQPDGKRLDARGLDKLRSRAMLRYNLAENSHLPL